MFHVTFDSYFCLQSSFSICDFFQIKDKCLCSKAMAHDNTVKPRLLAKNATASEVWSVYVCIIWMGCSGNLLMQVLGQFLNACKSLQSKFWTYITDSEAHFFLKMYKFVSFLSHAVKIPKLHQIPITSAAHQQLMPIILVISSGSNVDNWQINHHLAVTFHWHTLMVPLVLVRLWAKRAVLERSSMWHKHTTPLP